MQISGGDKCGNGVSRKAFFWFKCDPSVTVMPTTVQVSEADPSNPSIPTWCTYYFAPIPFAGFCPTSRQTGGLVGAEIFNAVSVAKPLHDVDIVTTAPLMLMRAGFSCSRLPLKCTTQKAVFGCSMQKLSNSTVMTYMLNITAVSFSHGSATFSYSTSNSGKSGDCSVPGPFLSATGGGAWVASGPSFVAYVDGAAVATLTTVFGVSPACNQCTKEKSVRLSDA